MGFSFLEFLDKLIKGFGQSQRESLAALTCVELKELENIFTLLLLGSFAGFAAPPTFLSVELLPYLERELRVMNTRAENSSDMLAELFGTLGD
jgi:hypothetical protein